MATIYKICGRAAWRGGRSRRRVSPARRPIARDGFIHFSTAAQVAETAAKHFAGQSDLLLVAVDGDALGAAAANGSPRAAASCFRTSMPPLPLSAVLWARPLAARPDGRHVFPELEP